MKNKENNSNTHTNEKASKAKQTLISQKIEYTPTGRVIRAISDAELVLSYIAEHGINVDKNLITTIISAKEAYKLRNWNKEIEEKFWEAYNKLPALIKPITVDSIKAVEEKPIKNPNFFQKILGKKHYVSVAYKSARFYTIFAIITMIIMLILHIYFSIGTVRLNKILKNDKKIAELENQINDLEMISRGSSETNLSVEFKKDKLYNKLFEINTEKESNIKLLNDWLYFIRKILFIKKESKQIKATQTEPETPQAPPSPQETLTYHIETINDAENYLLVIGYYILPLLYGLLGAITFVLRELRNMIKNMQFTKETNINFALRLILGTIAGLAVGVFWGEITQQETLKFISTLGQLLVAFIAGYLVEYVFIVLERSVKLVFDKSLLAVKNNKKQNK